MKIKKVTKPISVKAEKKPIEVTDIDVRIPLSAEDSKALNAYRSFIQVNTMKETKFHALENRWLIKDLLVKEEDPAHSTTVLKLPVNLHEQLSSEAKKFNLSLNTYIRAIFYTLGKDVIEQKMEKRQLIATTNWEHRYIPIECSLNQGMRMSMYEVYGEVFDNVLQQKVANALPHLLQDERVVKILKEIDKQSPHLF